MHTYIGFRYLHNYILNRRFSSPNNTQYGFMSVTPKEIYYSSSRHNILPRNIEYINA